MTKEIHFYSYSEPYAIGSWNATQNAIENNAPCIRTLQMGMLNANLFKKGYRIFIHEKPDNSYEIKLGGYNEWTNREIRIAHNLFKMWRAGEFDA